MRRLEPGGEQVPERLVVVSDVVHYRHGERSLPMLRRRELDVWVDLFDEE